MIYLNQAGTSWPKPPAVHLAVQEALQAPPLAWADRLTDQHRRVCNAFGVADPQRLLLTPGATSALSVAIADHTWSPGDRVLISSWEHHALHRPVQKLAQQGVRVTVIPPGDGQPVALGELEEELQRGDVRLVAMTAACNVTGTLLPVADIIGLARRHGALSLIDAAQVAGWMPLDLDSLGADLVVFTGHKAPHAPWGIGALFVRSGVSMASPRAACELPPAGSGPACAPLPGACDVGTIDRLALAGLVAGLQWLEEPQQGGRLSQSRLRCQRLAEVIAELPGARLHGRDRPEDSLPTIAMTVQGRAPEELARLLADRRVLVGSGQQCAPLAHETLGTFPDGVLRISFGAMNTDDDGTAVAAALAEILH